MPSTASQISAQIPFIIAGMFFSDGFGSVADK
jgi:hypothetical protein